MNETAEKILLLAAEILRRSGIARHRRRGPGDELDVDAAIREAAVALGFARSARAALHAESTLRQRVAPDAPSLARWSDGEPDDDRILAEITAAAESLRSHA